MPFPFNLESSLEASEVYFLLNYNAFSNIRTRDLEEIRRMFADGRGEILHFESPSTNKSHFFDKVLSQFIFFRIKKLVTITIEILF